MCASQESSATLTPRIPSLCLHKPTGQGYVTLGGRMLYLGKYGIPETLQRYHQLIAEWLAAGGQLPVQPEEITVKEIMARFLVHAKGYYRNADGTLTCEYNNFVQAMRPLKELYGLTKAVEFGPLALKAVRHRMIDMGWCRKNVNSNVGRLKTVFRWATEQELIPGNVYHALLSVAGLKRGRSSARESEPVRPVAMELVDGIQPFVSKQVWTMIQLQLLTAARPGELAVMRPCDIDRSGNVWLYQPPVHKTLHHGLDRIIYLGPRAQAILLPLLLRPAESYIFSAQDAIRDWLQRKHQARKTPMSCGNVPGSNRKDEPVRSPGEHYTTESYARAISRACQVAFPPPEHLRKREGETRKEYVARLTPEEKAKLKAWHKSHRWHPHQLRHNAATFIRKEFGLEAARIILGHRSAVITEIYAEMDQQKAVEAMLRVG